MYLSGESYLSLNHPIYKRRYVASCDLVLGCRIGCDFCYYQFGPTAPHFRRGSAILKPLATPEQFAEALIRSKLIRPGDGVIVSARSDLSMPEHKAAFRELLRIYPQQEKPVTFLVLQRGAYSARDWEEFGPHQVFFGTTITPCAAERGFNTVRDEAQLDGLRALRAAGCPAERISIELGPILPDTVAQAVAIARCLADEGIAAYLTYRGASVGQYGDYSAAIADLKARGFFEELVPYTYDDGKGNTKPHEYYLLKNHLPAAVEAAFLAGASGSGLRLYRHTGHMYAREWGLKVAASRNNRVREEMLGYARAWTLDEFTEALRTHFGLDCPVEAVEPGERSRVFRLDRRGTEDVAHAIGAQTQTAVLFSDYSNLPTMDDLTWYRDEGWLHGLTLGADQGHKRDPGREIR